MYQILKDILDQEKLEGVYINRREVISKYEQQIKTPDSNEDSEASEE